MSGRCLSGRPAWAVRESRGSDVCGQDVTHQWWPGTREGQGQWASEGDGTPTGDTCFLPGPRCQPCTSQQLMPPAFSIDDTTPRSHLHAYESAPHAPDTTTGYSH